jgi:hypothetical protein
VSLSANAFWGNNNGPWSNGYNNNNYGYQQDNGIFGYNPYEFWGSMGDFFKPCPSKTQAGFKKSPSG